MFSVSALCRIADSIPAWREFQGDSDRFPKTPILSWSLSVLELRHGLSPARSRRPHGRPAEAGRRLSARNLYPAARQGAVQGARLSHPLSQGRLYERGRKLARTARRRHRIHDATAAQRRLAGSETRGMATLPRSRPAAAGRIGADRRPELFFRRAQQFMARPIDEMKPTAGLA